MRAVIYPIIGFLVLCVLLLILEEITKTWRNQIYNRLISQLIELINISFELIILYNIILFNKITFEESWAKTNFWALIIICLFMSYFECIGVSILLLVDTFF